MSERAELIRNSMMNTPKDFLPEKAGDTDAVVQVNITGDDGGEWYLVIKDKQCQVFEGVHENPDCTTTYSDQTYMDIENGKYGEMRAMMTGKLKVKNMGLATKVDKMFKKKN